MNQRPESERRRSFRVNDHIGLKLRVIPDKEQDSFKESFNTWRQEHGLINQFLHQRTQLLPLIRTIENTQPDIAAYLRHLESKIDTLAGLFQARDQNLPRIPTHSVNLSANGLRFYHDEEIPENTLLQIQLVLFPSLTIIPALGEVISCKPETQTEIPHYQLTVDFTLMDEDDRDLLTTHNVTAQMKALQHDYDASS
jgi:hypothetical protein